MAERTLTTIDFHDQQLLAFEREGKVYVALRPIAEGMGVSWVGQLQRIRRDAILGPAVCAMHTPFNRHGQEETCLPLELTHGWLFTIDDKKVKPEVREKVLTYKRECYAVLFAHFYGNAEARAQGEPVRSEAEKRALVNDARLCFGPQVGQEMWLKMGLPTVPRMFQRPAQGGLFDPPEQDADLDALTPVAGRA